MRLTTSFAITAGTCVALYGVLYLASGGETPPPPPPPPDKTLAFDTPVGTTSAVSVGVEEEKPRDDEKIARDNPPPPPVVNEQVASSLPDAPPPPSRSPAKRRPVAEEAAPSPPPTAARTAFVAGNGLLGRGGALLELEINVTPSRLACRDALAQHGLELIAIRLAEKDLVGDAMVVSGKTNPRLIDSDAEFAKVRRALSQRRCILLASDDKSALSAVVRDALAVWRKDPQAFHIYLALSPELTADLDGRIAALCKQRNLDTATIKALARLDVLERKCDLHVDDVAVVKPIRALNESVSTSTPTKGPKS